MQNHATAQYNLGWCYENGFGVEPDLDKALVWYHKSALQGQITAQYTLGWCYGNGRGMEVDMAKAVHWYTKAAEQGHTTAQLNLGWCHLNGKGTPVNREEALKWYLKAAEQGNATAMFNVGNCYAHGYGIEQDDKQAEEWYQKAVRHGNKRPPAPCAIWPPNRKKRNKRTRRPEQAFSCLLLSSNQVQPWTHEGKTCSHGLKNVLPLGNRRLTAVTPGSSSPPLPSIRRAFSGQPFHGLRQPGCAIAAQRCVNIFQRMDQVNNLPAGQGAPGRYAEMSAARQRPAFINHASSLPAQERAAPVRRQLQPGASGSTPRLPGHPCLPQRYMRRLPGQAEPAAIRRTGTETLGTGSAEGAFTQKAPHLHQHPGGGGHSSRLSLAAFATRHDRNG